MPGGRPKGSLNRTTESVKKMAQEHGPRAIRRLAEIMESEDEKAARAAASDLLNRAYGMPKQMVEMDADISIRSVTVEFMDK